MAAADDSLRAMLTQVSTPEELRALIEAPGVDDKVINEFVSGIGPAPALDRLFTIMATRFLPDKAGRDSGVVQWNIDTPEGRHVYHVVIANGEAAAGQGPADKPRTTLTMSTPNLMRLCAGRLNGVTAVMTGKIKISGDLMFGAKLQSFFDY